MRSTRRPDLDDVSAVFEGWRTQPGRRTIPDDLWLAAASLLDRHTANAVCERLRLNESRFRRMRERLGVAPHRSRRWAATDLLTETTKRRSTPPRNRVRKASREGKRAGAGLVTASRKATPVSDPAGGRPAPAAFIELGALTMDPLGRPVTVAGDAAQSCSLTIERPDGLRVRFEWPAADASSIGSVCEVLLGGDRPQQQPDHRRERRRR